jgi:transposase
MMSESRRKFSKEYKLRAVERSYQAESISGLAKELGIRTPLLYRWRSELLKHEESSFSGHGTERLSPEEAQIRLLEKALRIKDQELEILKKAIGIFSMSDRTSTGS